MRRNNGVDGWVEKAEGDYETVVDLGSKRKKRQLYIIAFHCQQCIEKYLKALLTMYEIEFPKQHDLEALLGLIVRKDPFLEALRNDLKELTPYAVEFRYPGEDVTKEEVKEAVRMTRRVRLIIRKRMGLKK